MIGFEGVDNIENDEVSNLLVLFKLNDLAHSWNGATGFNRFVGYSSGVIADMNIHFLLGCLICGNFILTDNPLGFRPQHFLRNSA